MRSVGRLAARLITGVLFVAVLVLGALGMVDNQAQIALHFLQWRTVELSIYWWLFSALVLGFVLGWALAALSALRRRTSPRHGKG